MSALCQHWIRSLGSKDENEDRTFQKKCIISQAELGTAVGRSGAAAAYGRACPTQG